MKTRLALLAAALLAVFAPLQCFASSGTPDSPQFGFGMHIDLSGEHVTVAVQTAARMGADWVSLDFDWASRWPDTATSPQIEDLTQAVAVIGQYQMDVMLSITNAPGWALTPTGPDPNLTAGVVSALARLYPDNLRAVELFPGANTGQGWGAPPNPAAYMTLLRASRAALDNDKSSVWLVAAGLAPATPGSQESNEMDALVFLRALYTSGSPADLPIISLRLMNPSGSILDDPQTGAGYSLRYFESIRQVMMEFDHRAGLIWITGFTWPHAAQAGAPAPLSENDQAAWISQAYRLIKTQLYIGAAFFAQLNPPAAPQPQAPHLLRSNLSLHSAAARIAQTIDPGAPPELSTSDQSLSKKLPPDLQLKPRGTP